MKHLVQLKTILKAADWSQEQLAAKLGVSFATINSWINARSTPRKNALIKIEKLYSSIAGSAEIDRSTADESIKIANKMSLSADTIIEDPRMFESLTLHLTYNTNTIEGSTMTLSDVEDVLLHDKVLHSRTAIEQAEARNHQAALEWLMNQISLRGDEFAVDEGLILSIHLRLMNGIISDAGQYRKHSVRIMGARVPLANWASIPDLVAKLTESTKNTRRSKDVVRSISRFHADFEKIHPFSDGNGRTGRLILLAQALQYKIVPPIIQKERKAAYYKYLELAQVDSKYEYLDLFIAESIMYANTLLEKR